MSFIFRRELKMKLVSDKPTKSFRLLGFLSLSFSFFLSLSPSSPVSSSHILYRFPSFFLLQSAPSYWILSPSFSPLPIRPSLLFYKFFLFFSFLRIIREERKRGKGRREKSDTFSLRRFASFSIPNFTLSQNEASSLPFVPPQPTPDLPYRLSH